jgi:hypothetical protein
MTVIQHKLRARCSAAVLWRELADLEAVGQHNPAVARARIRGGVAHGVGTVRACDLVPKGRVVERVTQWEEGRSLGFEIVESDWPVRSMQWSTRVEPEGGGCVLSQRLEYQMKYGAAGWVLNAVLLRRVMTGAIGTALKNLVELAEGKSV